MIEPILVEDLMKGALIFLRLSGVVFFLPIFGDVPTPARVRVFIAAGLSLAFYQLVPQAFSIEAINDPFTLGWLIVREMLIGCTIGFCARVAFEGMIMASTLVGFQMGFGMANLLVPDAGQQLTSFSALHRIIVISIFFALNLHFLFINGIAESLQILPIGSAVTTAKFAHSLINMTADLFVIAIQLAAPVLVALLFAMAALGLAARAVPQLNVFVISFPISFFVGLLVYIASIPFMPDWVSGHFQTNHERTLSILNMMRP